MKNRNRWNNRKGFTMAELLLVVAIIVILAALAFVGITRYLRNLHLLEMDNAAKQVFYAAQNRITAELNSGTLGRLDATAYEVDTSNASTKGAPAKTNMVIFNSGVSDLKKTLWDEMLPFGAIDEAVRAGGSYIITYSLDTDANLATVLDVWYASDKSSGIGRNWSGSESTLRGAAYAQLTAAKGDAGKSNRLRFPGGSGSAIIGHYGRDTVTALNQLYNFKNLSFKLVNDEVLYGDFSFQAENLRPTKTDMTTSAILDTLAPRIKLTVTGAESKATKTILYDIKTVDGSGIIVRLSDPDTNTLAYRFIFDNIAKSGQRFRDLVKEGSEGLTGTFIPGEDIRVNLEVYSNSVLSNIESISAVDNSLFQYVKTTTDAGTTTTEAGIGKVRHLQNLSSDVSGVNYSKEKTQINKALQTDDLLWDNEGHTGGFVNFKLDGSTPLGGNIYYNETNTTSSFHPIDVKSVLVYEAGFKDNAGNDKRHAISGLKVSGADDAGLFGTVKTPTGTPLNEGDILLTVQNLEMNGANMSGKNTAGVVIANEVNAARLSNISINAATVQATDGNAGGVVGKAVNGLDVLNTSVTDSGVTAARGNAGGLVGDFSESGDASTGVHLQISNSYVVNKDGDKPVTGNVAGGLVGMLKAAFPQFTKSYSTAIVSGTDAAGGLVGTLQNSYTGNKGTSYIYGCYVGGHVETKENKPVYSSENFNVTATGTAGSAGGFFGKVVANMGALNVEACYSTASASGDTAGGFVGKVEGNGAGQYSVSNCYAVGLVKDTTPDTTPSGAFGGDGAYTLKFSDSMNNLYFELINGSMPAVVTPENSVAKNGIIAAESSLGTYNAFFVNDSSKVLDAYNSKLTEMFKSVYFLPTVQKLADNASGSDAVKALNTENPLTTHVGDWQPVDTLVLN